MASERGRVGLPYPTSGDELASWFAHDAACRSYLEELRWPTGFVCPGCAATRAWRTKEARWKCAACHRRTGVTAGTILDGIRVPLTTWFDAAWELVSQRNGVSAAELQRALNLRYATAWSVLHRLRSAMSPPEDERLTGRVEVDETVIDGVHHTSQKGNGAAASIVGLAVEVERPKGYERIRLCVLDSYAARDLVPFVRGAVTPGATVVTDGWRGYDSLPDRGYALEEVAAPDRRFAQVRAPAATERVASLLERWLHDTHHGVVDPRYLQAYLNEYAFRYNRPASEPRGVLFRRLLQQAVTLPGSSVASAPTRPR